MPVRVAPADAKHFIFPCHAHAVAKWLWQFAGLAPRAVRLVEHPHVVIPNLRATFPRTLLREVCPARNHERIAADSRKHGGEAFAIRERTKLRRLGSMGHGRKRNKKTPNAKDQGKY